MTVSTTTSRTSYAGNGSTVTFTVPWYFLANADLVVIKTSTSGIETTLVLNTDYTVAGAGVVAGGTVTCTTAPASGDTLVIYRDPAATQLTDYQANDPFPAETHERALDKLTMIAQRVKDLTTRSFRLSDGDATTASTTLPSPEASNIVGWNDSATALQNYDVGTLATVVSYGTARADLFSGNGSTTAFTLSANPGAQANLDVSISGVQQRPGLDYAWLSGTTITFTSAPPSGTSNILVRYMQGLAQGTSDSASASFIQSGTGAVTRMAQDKLRETISVKDFGAKGDGVTDDAAAIQAAISAAGNNATVLLPAGTYVIGSAGLLVSGKTGLQIRGDRAILKITGAASQTFGAFSATQILFSNCTRSGLFGVEINGNSVSVNAVGFSACTDCVFDDNTVYSSGNNGQVIAGGGTRNRFRRNTIYSSIGTARGMWLGNNNATDMEVDLVVDGNVVRANAATGIVFNSVGGRVSNNHALANSGAGIIFPGASGYAARKVSCVGNYCSGNSFHGIQWDVPSYSTDADLPSDIVCSGNTCAGNSNSGIYAVNSLRAVLTGNVCCDNVTAGIQADDRGKQITITGNECSDTRTSGQTQQRGIRVIAQAVSNSGAVISGNTCNNNTTQGICVQSSASGITLSNVNVSGNVCMNNAQWGNFHV